MIFQRVNRSDAEKVFVVCKNASGGDFSAGAAVQWDVSTSGDGVRVTTPATAELSAFAGILPSAITNGSYGLVQVYGKANATVYNDITTAGTAGNIMLPVNTKAYLSAAAANSDASDGKSGFVIAMTTLATATTPVANTKAVFVRAL